MKATDFVKKFGIDLVKRDIAAWQSGFIKREDFLENYGFDILDDLKQIVDAFEFVSAHGSIDIAKKYISTMDADGTSKHYDKLRTFINLVEQCNA